jgi:hypothetical protein
MIRSEYVRPQGLDALGTPCIQWACTPAWSEGCVEMPLGPIEMLGKLRIDPRHSIQTDNNVYDHGPRMCSYTLLRRVPRSPVGAPCAAEHHRYQHIASRTIAEGIDHAASKGCRPERESTMVCYQTLRLSLAGDSRTCGRRS